MTATLPPRAAPEIIALIAVVETSSDDVARASALEQITLCGTSDCSRLLIEVFERSRWRSIQVAIVRALGRLPSHRSVEFLLRLASDEVDFALGAEAVLSLGATKTPIAGEYLLRLVEEADHPLRREAVIALTQMPEFPCDDELLTLLEASERTNSPLSQYLLLALGRRATRRAWPLVRRWLNPKAAETNPNIFNAALLSAGELGGEEALDALETLDTRYRFFADQLRVDALAKIRLRLSRPLQEAVETLLTSSPKAWAFHAHALRNYPEAEAFRAFEKVASSAAPTVQCLVRTILFDSEREASDLQFLVRHARELDPVWAAALVRLHQRRGPRSQRRFMEELYVHVDTATAIQWLSLIHEPTLVTKLCNISSDPSADIAIRVEAINAMVAQAQMAGPARSGGPEIATELLRVLRACSEPALRGRVVRALGQVGCANQSCLQTIERLLESEPDIRSSAYSALGMMRTADSAQVIVTRLRALQSLPESDAEADLALGALAKMGPVAEAESLQCILAFSSPSRTESLLKILTANAIVGGDAVVETALSLRSERIRMLAVAAAKLNTNARISAKLFALLESQSPAESGRALDSLCVGGGVREHRFLIQRLTPHPKDRERAIKIFRSLRPDPTADYSAIISMIERLLATKTGIFADTEVVEAASHLCDIIGAAAPKSVRQYAVSLGRAPNNARAQLDRSLVALMPQFEQLSEPAKSALRNAELTHSHPELFGDQVDKSTMIVEYVKSIDLLLQDRLFSQMFTVTPERIFARMQSRVVELQIDEENLTSLQLVRDLDCEEFFSFNQFPSHKMGALARFILSGKILRDPQRVIDGLRAWSLLLLVFARTFRFRALSVEPILRVRKSDNREIGALVAALNELQEIRNLAAHRTTMLAGPQIDELREQSFRVLSKLGEVLW